MTTTLGLTALLTLATDQGSKHVALAQLANGRVALVTRWLRFRVVANPTPFFAAGETRSASLALWASSLAALALLSRYVERLGDPAAQLGLGVAIGGATGNLVDRLLRGAVIDFIDVKIGRWWWPTFNLADAAIALGVMTALWGMR